MRSRLHLPVKETLRAPLPIDRVWYVTGSALPADAPLSNVNGFCKGFDFSNPRVLASSPSTSGSRANSVLFLLMAMRLGAVPGCLSNPGITTLLLTNLDAKVEMNGCLGKPAPVFFRALRASETDEFEKDTFACAIFI